MAFLNINGQKKTFSNGLPTSLAKLLEVLKVDQATVVAEINGSIIKRSDFPQTSLENGQKIELIKLVGGG